MHCGVPASQPVYKTRIYPEMDQCPEKGKSWHESYRVQHRFKFLHFCLKKRHGGESSNFRTATMVDTGCNETTVDSGKTFFDIFVNISHIRMEFEVDTTENDSNMPILYDFHTKIWFKIY